MFIKLTLLLHIDKLILHVDKTFIPVLYNSDRIEKFKDINDIGSDKVSIDKKWKCGSIMEDEDARALGAKTRIDTISTNGTLYARESLDEIYEMLKGH